MVEMQMVREGHKKGKTPVVNFVYFLLVLSVFSSCVVSHDYKTSVVKNVRSDSLSTVFVDFKDSLNKKIPLCWVAVDKEKRYEVIDTTGIHITLEPGKHKFEAGCFPYFKEATKKIELFPGDSLALIFYLREDRRPLIH